MQFDAALAAQAALQEAEIELGFDWDTAIEPKSIFSSHAGSTAWEAHESITSIRNLSYYRQYPVR